MEMIMNTPSWTLKSFSGEVCEEPSRFYIAAAKRIRLAGIDGEL